jgi:hypothetical protein
MDLLYRPAPFGNNRNDRAEMTRPEPPEIEIGHLTAVGFIWDQPFALQRFTA